MASRSVLLLLFFLVALVCILVGVCVCVRVEQEGFESFQAGGFSFVVGLLCGVPASGGAVLASADVEVNAPRGVGGQYSVGMFLLRIPLHIFVYTYTHIYIDVRASIPPHNSIDISCWLHHVLTVLFWRFGPQYSMLLRCSVIVQYLSGVASC